MFTLGTQRSSPPAALRFSILDGLSFEEAVQVFRDPLQISLQDRIENGEERWQTFGVVGGVLLVMVAHTVQEEDQVETVVRIISARRADRKERRFYEDENG